MGRRAPRPRRRRPSAWCIKTQPGEQWEVMRELRCGIRRRSTPRASRSPFPQRTLWAPQPRGPEPRPSESPDPGTPRRRRAVGSGGARVTSTLRGLGLLGDERWPCGRAPSRRRRPGRRAARRSAVSRTTTGSTSARRERLASVLALRISPSDVSGHRRRPAGRRRRRRMRISVGLGPGGRWTEPSCHHDQTSSVTKGRNGANSRSRVDERQLERGLGRRGGRLALVAVGPALHQLEVVVAEAPEERLGALERPGVVVALERGGGLVDQRRPAGPSMARSSGSVTARRPAAGASPSCRPRTNFEALRILMASRRPTFIWPSSKAVSVPGRPLAAQ